GRAAHATGPGSTLCLLYIPQRIHIVLRICPIDLLRWINSINILLNVAVAIAVYVFCGVGWIIGIQTVFCFPIIGHAVTVAVLIRLAFIIRITANLNWICDDSFGNQREQFVDGLLGVSAVAQFFDRIL